MTFREIQRKWQEGILTDYGAYEECETDLDFYNLLALEGYDEYDIKEIMRNVSGADDAYYNALDQADYM